MKGAVRFEDDPEAIYHLAVTANYAARVFGGYFDGGTRLGDPDFQLAWIAKQGGYEVTQKVSHFSLYFKQAADFFRRLGSFGNPGFD